MAQATPICTLDEGIRAERQQDQFTSTPENATRALPSSTIHYKAVRERLAAEDPTLDEQTLADTVEGLTDLHEILMAVIRAALADEALASGLKGRIGEMEDRLGRLQDRASKRRQIAKEVMAELDLKKLQAPDFTASIRSGLPSLMVINEGAEGPQARSG
jgi:hypothetical protein